MGYIPALHASSHSSLSVLDFAAKYIISTLSPICVVCVCVHVYVGVHVCGVYVGVVCVVCM